MNRLQGKTLFSKFDIRHRHNNIRLAKEDRHKAAIQTRHGMYIPEVMYFGMCNAPAFFQRTVTHGLLVRFCLLCGDRTAYCTDMGSCECGLLFLEPSDLSLVSFRTSDGGLVIR